MRALARFLLAARRTRGPVYAVDLAVAPVLAGVLTTVFGRRLIVDTGDSPAAFLRLVRASWLARAAATALEWVTWRRATLVIVRGREHERRLRARGLSAVVTVPDGVDLDVICPVDASAVRDRLGLGSAPTVGMAGSYTWHPRLGGGLGGELVRALAMPACSGVHGVFVGDGPGVVHLRSLAESLGVADRVHLVGRVAYEDLAEHLAACDVLVLTMTDDPSSQIRTTGKLPVYLASGRFVLASRVGTAAEVLPPEMLIDYEGSWDGAYAAKLSSRLASVLVDAERDQKGARLRELATQFSYVTVAAQAAAAVRAAVDS